MLDKIITSGNKKNEQYEDLKSGLISHNAAEGKDRISNSLTTMTTLPKSEFMPKKPNTSGFSTVVEVEATDEKGDPYKVDGKTIMKKVTIITDEALKDEVMGTYECEKELALKAYVQYKLDQRSNLYLTKGQVHPNVWQQAEESPGFKEKFGKGDLIGCFEILHCVCGCEQRRDI